MSIENPNIAKNQEAASEREYIEFWKDDYYRELFDSLENKTEEGKSKFNEWVGCWTPELRKSYLEVGAEFTSDLHDRKVDTIVFMDKSARSLAQFIRSLWKRIFPGEPIPEMKFMVPIGYENMAVERDDKDYESGIKRRADKFKKIFSDFSEQFENKNVCLVDEIVVEGYGLDIAKDVVKKVFPTAKIIKGCLYGSSMTDIPAPEGSDYTLFAKDAHALELGRMLYKDPDKGIEEVEGSVISKRIPRQRPLKETRGYKLNLVGKNEKLDEKSIKGINRRIRYTHNEKERLRLERIKERYEKLL